MKLLTTIPALPAADIEKSAAFYRDKLAFEIGHQEPEFCILRRNGIEIHLWAATDQSWKTRVASDVSPVISGAESFLAGTASCRIAVEGIDELHQSVAPNGILYPDGPVKETYWGTREFHVLDLDGNLVTFFERVG